MLLSIISFGKKEANLYRRSLEVLEPKCESTLGLIQECIAYRFRISIMHLFTHYSLLFGFLCGCVVIFWLGSESSALRKEPAEE